MSEKSIDEHLLELARRLGRGHAEEIAAAEVLCLVATCLEKGCVLFVFGGLLEAARRAAAQGEAAIPELPSANAETTP
jgi:hypothetical protein